MLIPSYNFIVVTKLLIEIRGVETSLGFLNLPVIEYLALISILIQRLLHATCLTVLQYSALPKICQQFFRRFLKIFGKRVGLGGLAARGWGWRARLVLEGGKMLLDGGGVGGDEAEAGVNVGVGDLDGAGEGGVVGLEVKEGIEALGFLGGADEGGGVAGVVLNGFVAGETFNVAPMRQKPVQGAGAGVGVAQEVDIEEEVILGADDVGLF